MSIVDALQGGKFEFIKGAAGEVTIILGNGKNVVNVVAGKANITTGMGDDTVIFSGNSFDITDFGGENFYQITGNLEDTTTKNTMNLSDGKDTALVAANNVDFNDGDGDLTLVSLGDGLDVTSKNGDHNISFWGDKINIALADGDNSIQTIDKTLKNATAPTIKVLEEMGMIAALEKDTTTSVNNLGSEIVGDDRNQAIINKYNLNPEQQKILSQIDITAVYTNDAAKKGTPEYTTNKSLVGTPVYQLVPSVQNNNGYYDSKTYTPGMYVIAKRDSTSNHSWALVLDKTTGKIKTNSDGSYANGECLVQSSEGSKVQATDVTYSQFLRTTYQNVYTLNGVSDVNVYTGKGSNNVSITSANDKTNSIKIEVEEKNNANNNIFITPPYSVTDPKTWTQDSEAKQGKTTIYAAASAIHNSPLIVDFNKDGKVSAKAGLGVDIDNNGTADGAAVDGDKMLAMSDINGNKNIDGQEVFGNKTISPFTGQPLNAANGFEALKVIAEQAKQYTGIDCIKYGSVDLQLLKAALAKVGVNLGFISAENTTDLEDLGHVASINVTNYEEKDASGDVQHRQLGSYIDVDGTMQKVDDVWFKA